MLPCRDAQSIVPAEQSSVSAGACALNEKLRAHDLNRTADAGEAGMLSNDQEAIPSFRPAVFEMTKFDMPPMTNPTATTPYNAPANS